MVDGPDAPAPTAVATRVGSDAAAHLEQRLTLIELGWHVIDAFPTRWSGDAARAAIELAADIGATHTVSGQPRGEDPAGRPDSRER